MPGKLSVLPMFPSCCDKASDESDSRKGGFILAHSSGVHSPSWQHQQLGSRFRRMPELSLLSPLLRVPAIGCCCSHSGWVLLSQAFLLTTSWAHPRFCFRGDSKCRRADNADGPSSLSKFLLWLSDPVYSRAVRAVESSEAYPRPCSE